MPSSTASSAAAALTFVNSASAAMCSTSSSLFMWPLLWRLNLVADALGMSAPAALFFSRTGESTQAGVTLLAKNHRSRKGLRGARP